MADPVLKDLHSHLLQEESLQREHERKQEEANRIQRICLRDAPSLAEAIREEGDEALASALLLLRTNPGNGAIVCVNTAVSDCVKRYADKLAEAKFESGEYAEELPF